MDAFVFLVTSQLNVNCLHKFNKKNSTVCPTNKAKKGWVFRYEKDGGGDLFYNLFSFIFQIKLAKLQKIILMGNISYFILHLVSHYIHLNFSKQMAK